MKKMSTSELATHNAYSRNIYFNLKKFTLFINIDCEINMNEWFIIPSFSIQLWERESKKIGKFVTVGLRMYWLVGCYSISFGRFGK